MVCFRFGDVMGVGCMMGKAASQKAVSKIGAFLGCFLLQDLLIGRWSFQMEKKKNTYIQGIEHGYSQSVCSIFGAVIEQSLRDEFVFSSHECQSRSL